MLSRSGSAPPLMPKPLCGLGHGAANTPLDRIWKPGAVQRNSNEEVAYDSFRVPAVLCATAA